MERHQDELAVCELSSTMVQCVGLDFFFLCDVAPVAFMDDLGSGYLFGTSLC